MAGFISGEGSFSRIPRAPLRQLRVAGGLEDKYISLSFRVYQHSKDEELLKSFVNYFGCGNFNYHNKDKKLQHL
jgi:hypothetical protein